MNLPQLLSKFTPSSYGKIDEGHIRQSRIYRSVIAIQCRLDLPQRVRSYITPAFLIPIVLFLTPSPLSRNFRWLPMPPNLTLRIDVICEAFQMYWERWSLWSQNKCSHGRSHFNRPSCNRTGGSIEEGVRTLELARQAP